MNIASSNPTLGESWSKRGCRIPCSSLVVTEAFVKGTSNLFEQYTAAYRLNTSQRPYCFFSQASKEQGEATRQAVETICESNFDGAAAHLRQATRHINAVR